MADSLGTDIGKWAAWPPYAGYGPWTITIPEPAATVPGSGDNRISSDLLPASQWALKYLPLSNEISISAFVPGVSVINVIGGVYISFVYTTIGTLDVSYRNWLQTGQCATFDVVGSEVSNFGPVPPTLDYQIRDSFKETVHYGMHGVFLVAVETSGSVNFISMDSFYGYLEHVCRCRMKGVRLEMGDISSVTYIKNDYDASGVERWWYNLATNIPNEVVESMDLSSDSVEMTIYQTNTASGYTGTNITVIVDSIVGSTIKVRINASSTQTNTKIVEGWMGAHFTLNKTVLNQNPLTLYHERKLSSSTIPNNDYVTEGTYGYETREQQVHDSGQARGIYVSQSDLDVYLQKLIDDPTTSAANAAIYKADKAILDGDTVKRMTEEGLVYGAFEGDTAEVAWGMKLLNYTHDMAPKYVTLDMSIGGGATVRHNMHAGCLTGAYLQSALETYRISNHLRKNVFQVEVVSKTSATNLLDVLLATSPISSKTFDVRSQRMWVVNDITFGSENSGGTCDRGMFWGKLTGTPTATTASTTSVVLKLSDNGFYQLTTRDQLTNMYLQSVTPSSPTLLKKYAQFKDWKLNNVSGSLSHEIVNITNGIASDELIITLSGTLDSGSFTFNSDEWWISFCPLFSTSGYGYVSAPYLAMSGALSFNEDTGSGGSQAANAIALAGLYVSMPFREPIQENAVLSVVLENGGVYPSATSPPAIFLSTGKTGTSFSFAQNPYADSCYLVYRRENDTSMTLCARRGRLNFAQDLSEHLVYYGDANRDTTGVTVTGSPGNTIIITVGNQLDDHNIIGFSCKRAGAQAAQSNPPALVVWQAYHDNYALGYPCTSGLMYTLYSTRLANYVFEKGDYVPEYKRGNIITSGRVDYDLNVGSNTLSENIADKKNIKLVPVYGNPSSPMIGDVQLFCVPTQNFVTNATGTYIYAIDKHMDAVLFIKSQLWVRTGEGGYSSKDFTFQSQTKVKEGTTQITWPLFDDAKVKSLFDPDQDGLFLMTSDDQLRSFRAGMFSRPGSWVRPTTTSTAITGVTPSLDNLYQIPFLIVPNITLCAFTDNKSSFDVAGYSNLKSSATSSNRDVLGLVYYRVNVLDTLTCPIHIVNAKRSGGSSDQFVFSYPNMNPHFRRIVTGSTAYAENVSENAVFVDAGLSKGSLSLASENNVVFIFSDQPAGLVYFVSTNAGVDWSYFDDMNLATAGKSKISSPAIRYCDHHIWFFYMVNQSDLYFKKVNVGKMMAPVAACIARKSSDMKDSGFVTMKQTLQTYLDSCPEKFVAQIPEQQVSFEVDNQRDLLAVYMDADGKMRGINSKDQGASWNLSPVNF